MIEFEVLGNPVSLNNAYATGHNGRRFLSERGKAFKEEVGQIARLARMTQNDNEMITGDVTAHLTFYFGDLRVRDVDNCIKIALDALSGILFEDDSDITELHVYKRYDKNKPRTSFVIV